MKISNTEPLDRLEKWAKEEAGRLKNNIQIIIPYDEIGERTSRASGILHDLRSKFDDKEFVLDGLREVVDILLGDGAISRIFPEKEPEYDDFMNVIRISIEKYRELVDNLRGKTVI